MKSLKCFWLIFLLLLFFSTNLFSQEKFILSHIEPNEQDKCGYDEKLSRVLLQILGDHWGYGYDSLRIDLERWKQSPYISIDSIGASVQNRALWELTITAETLPVVPRKTIYIHARTHPNEVQSFWVTNEMINILLSESEFAQFIREKCVFYIIPMYNPDGVELEYSRQNANSIDIESNWYSANIQPEVVALRSRFSELMFSDTPIDVALNMHSSISGERYFVYHDAAGTSIAFTELEKLFIGHVRSYFLGGIAAWDYFISWTSGTPFKYPESWFWLNFQENVMALTYEDINGPTAGDFDKTANAILKGVADYLGLNFSTEVVENQSIPIHFELKQNFPNPFNASTTIQYSLPSDSFISIKIFDMNGKEITTAYNGYKDAGLHEFIWQAGKLSSGVYFYQIVVKQSEYSENIQNTIYKKATLLK